MSYYKHYPDMLGAAAIDPNGTPVLNEITPFDADLMYASLGAGQANLVSAFQNNPAMALYSSGSNKRYLAASCTPDCDPKCYGVCPDPRLRSIKPLYTPYVHDGYHANIYQTNGMY